MQRHRQTIRRWQARIATLGLALVPLSGLGQTPQATPTIEVFTIAGTPVTHVPPGTAVIELDAPARLDAELSQGLPNDLSAAEAVMRERMKSPEWKDAVQHYGDLHTGVTRAWMLGIEKVPAVVMGGQYVVYGETDLTKALNEIETYRQASAEEVTP